MNNHVVYLYILMIRQETIKLAVNKLASQKIKAYQYTLVEGPIKLVPQHGGLFGQLFKYTESLDLDSKYHAATISQLGQAVVQKGYQI